METTTETSSAVALETLRQINAGDFWARARWGVKHITVDGSTLTLICAGAPETRGKRIVITLDASDTYTVRVCKVGRSPSFKLTELGEMSFIYNDQLVRVIDRLMFGKN